MNLCIEEVDLILGSTAYLNLLLKDKKIIEMALYAIGDLALTERLLVLRAIFCSLMVSPTILHSDYKISMKLGVN